MADDDGIRDEVDVAVDRFERDEEVRQLRTRIAQLQARAAGLQHELTVARAALERRQRIQAHLAQVVNVAQLDGGVKALRLAAAEEPARGSSWPAHLLSRAAGLEARRDRLVAEVEGSLPTDIGGDPRG